MKKISLWAIFPNFELMKLKRSSIIQKRKENTLEKAKLMPLHHTNNLTAFFPISPASQNDTDPAQRANNTSNTAGRAKFSKGWE